jgi:hypothetical protein
MIKGGGGGRRYRPNAKAANPITAIASSGLDRIKRLLRAEQSSHTAPRTHDRQPFRVRRAPQVVQKFACMVGGSQLEHRGL